MLYWYAYQALLQATSTPPSGLYYEVCSGVLVGLGWDTVRPRGPYKVGLVRPTGLYYYGREVTYSVYVPPLAAHRTGTVTLYITKVHPRERRDLCTRYTPMPVTLYGV